MDDQKYRGASGNITETFSDVLDSLILSKRITKDYFLSLPEQQQGELKQKALKLASEKLKPLMEQNDSLRALQNCIDANNTKMLIEITKKHGWLTASGLECKEKFKTVLIFRHAPKKYWNEVRAIIEKERTAKRLTGYEYYVIDNHLKGRPPLTKKPSDFVDK
ncbi:hypothetical protein [Croceitalea vernalis]|uniref:Uncharacterized protein n=1 Tax=Croceitalea vernalis TaxID=3075599 RepID=A0ABU3BLA8_9FLAO|nr:hypothetical protein [Croceitalea sp. P007]MDT0622957.1 hypothetical protein [Croceitalea sp. P007]